MNPAARHVVDIGSVLYNMRMHSSINIAHRLTRIARERPFQRAIVAPAGRDRTGRVIYRQLAFAQLEDHSNRIAAGLIQRGLTPGTKLVLFVPFSIEFIVLTFALFKTGAVIVLIDPGMGRRNIFDCLRAVEPNGFVAIPVVHLIRMISLGKFPKVRFNVCVGPRWPGMMNDRDLLETDASDFEAVATRSSDAAAIIFTSGSTGPPKGVLYEHGMFDQQVELIQNFYGIQPGEIDLPGFPLFGLFNAAMGVTTVIPDMDPTRPATVDPEKILEAIEDQGVTQAFGSPAFWNRVGRHCEKQGITLPTVKRALSAGGPVPPHVLERMSRILINGDLHTPYGATESLPVTSIAASEILNETAAKTRLCQGSCVGRTFPGVDVKIIEITEGPIASLSDVRELPPSEVGEIIVSGPSVTREYFENPEATTLSKIVDGERFWHRIGDVGYRDEQGRLWFCGRKAHMVEADGQRMFSVCCEAIFNEHPRIYRTALVGVGDRPNQRPVIIAEPEAGQAPHSPADEKQLRDELLQLGRKHPHTARIEEIHFHPSLPVDTRHNVKINREVLSIWAAERLRLPASAGCSMHSEIREGEAPAEPQ